MVSTANQFLKHIRGSIKVLPGFRGWRLCSALVLLCFASISQAQWVQVTGNALIEKGLFDQARVQAREDALQKAAMEFGMRVHSEQEVRNGELIEDKVRFSAQAKIKRAEVREEYVSEGMLYMVMNVELEQTQSCPSSQAANYRKSIAVMGFAMQSPSHAQLGGLHSIDRGLAGALGRSLSEQGSLIVYSGTEQHFYADLANAPTRYAQEGQMTHLSHVAQDTGAQFIVSGVIRDLSLEEPSAYTKSRWNSLLRFGGLANTLRKFSVDVFVHDAFSGAIIWQENFSTVSDWDFESAEKIGFGTAQFWHAEYGRAVKKQVNTMAYLIAENLKCQPFMTRISRVDGKILHFSSGANTGIRPGDQFSLYRSYAFYDANRVTGFELQNVKTALTVSQVHPEFGSGTIGVEPGRINIQEDDLLVAW